MPSRIQILTSNELPFNLAASQCSGDILRFINSDSEVIDEDWPGRMEKYAIHPEVRVFVANLYSQTKPYNSLSECKN